MIDAQEINKQLGDRVEELCLYLLPNGKREGNKWMVGGIDGAAGNSFSVTMYGASAGRFFDFANPDSKGGTPLWLWSKVKGVPFVEAIKQAAEWLGVNPTDFGIKRHRQKVYSKPGSAPIRPTEPNTEISDYLVSERRLNPIIVAKAKICETNDGQHIAFPFIEKDPESGKEVCVHRKLMRLARPDGKKEITATKGTKRCLFGKNLIEDNVSEIVISEGEIDCLSWNSWSIPAVSVPNGVSDFEWIEIDWEWLARFEKIYVSMDMDDPGNNASQEICKRLGLHRCYIVSLPKKDANECLVGGITRDEALKWLGSAKAIELDEIKRPEDFRKDVIDHYTTDPSTIGCDTPWYPSVPWRVRPGEFTVLSGFSGSGKTMGLNQLMLHLIQQGLKIMDASLEIRPGLTLYYMTRCAMGKKHASKEEADACVSWLNDNIFFLDCIGTVNIDRILAGMEYARKRHGVDVFVIDSLFKCGLNSEDYGAARSFVDKLTAFCNNTGAHVILVAHSRKTQNGNELTAPSKSDVAGSSDITNAAFNVIIFWRHKKKKRMMDEATQKNDMQLMSEWEDQHDGKIILDKQRFGEGDECEAFVWFDKDSLQFHNTPNRKIPYFTSK